MGNLAWRDSNYTNEEGAWKHISKLFTDGVLSQSDLAVTQRGAGANMSVDVAEGASFIDSGLDYHHAGWNPTTANIPINASDPSNPRRTIIVEYIDLSVADTGSNNAPDGFDIIAVDGTAAAVPTDPSDPTIQSAVGASNPWRKLARVAVGTSVTSITNANITDLRTLSQATILLETLTVTEQINTTNTDKSVKILTGWGQIIGNDGANISETVTFGEAFASAPIVVASPLGFKNGSAATAIGDFATAGGSKTIMISPTSVTTTNFSAYLTMAGTLGSTTQAFSSSGYWGYSWTAIGEAA